MQSFPVKIFATRGAEELARGICATLESRFSIHFGEVCLETFSNENIQVQIDNVRGHFAVVIDTHSPPVHDRLFELFALLDAIINARPTDILLVFPYMDYCRSDRKNKPRISTMGQRLPDILTKSFGIKRVLLLDPHDTHVKHYFYPAADEISAIFLLLDYLKREVFSAKERKESAIVFPDAGSAKRYGDLARILDLPQAYIDKDRYDDREDVKIKRIVGEVKDKFCLLVDDEILSGGTAIGDTETLLNEGAHSVCMTAIHAILSKKGVTDAELVRQLENSPIEKFIVTDSIPVRRKLEGTTKFVVLSVVKLLAEAVERTVLDKSLTELYQPENVFLYR